MYGDVVFQIDVTLRTAAMDDMESFSHLYEANKQRGIKESHIWLSVFFRPPRYHNHTRITTSIYTYLCSVRPKLNSPKCVAYTCIKAVCMCYLPILFYFQESVGISSIPLHPLNVTQIKSCFHHAGSRTFHCRSEFPAHSARRPC